MTDEEVSGEPAVDKPKTDFELETNEPKTEEPKKSEVKEEVKEEKSDDQGEGKKSRRGGWQRKIEKLELENAELRKLKEAKQEDAKPAEPAKDGRPVPDDFKDWDTYNEALIDWKADQKIVKALEEKSQKDEAAAKEAKAKEEKLTQIERYQDNVDKAKEAYPDFEEVIKSYEGPLTLEMQDALLDSEIGPEIAYYLAKPENLDLAEDISQMTVAGMIKAFGKIEALLETKSQTPAVKTTKSPPPINPVKAKSSGSKLEYTENMPFEDYKRMRLANKTR